MRPNHRPGQVYRPDRIRRPARSDLGTGSLAVSAHGAAATVSTMTPDPWLDTLFAPAGRLAATVAWPRALRRAFQRAATATVGWVQQTLRQVQGLAAGGHAERARAESLRRTSVSGAGFRRRGTAADRCPHLPLDAHKPLDRIVVLRRCGWGRRPGGFRLQRHAGVDLQARHGTAVRAFAAGRIRHVGVEVRGEGLYVDIEHAQGLVTRYAHLHALAPGMRVGSRMVAGTPFAASGDSGAAGRAHLHFEVRRHGRTLDPEPFLQRARQAV